MRFSAVILAGGRSSRMGHDKALLDFNGQPLLARQIALARSLGPVEVLLSGGTGAPYASFGCPVLTDEFASAGPLAGIAAGLTSAAAPLVLVLAVDMPGMTAATLRQLLERCASGAGVVPRVNRRLEPLAAFYPKAAAPLAVDLLRSGLRTVRAFVEECQARGFVAVQDAAEADWNCFANWNSPADLPPPGL